MLPILIFNLRRLISPCMKTPIHSTLAPSTGAISLLLPAVDQAKTN